MIKGKAAYLNRLYSKFKLKSIEVDEKVLGSTPPSIFIGRYNYPRVFVGPLLPPVHGNTAHFDLPENWLKYKVGDVINFRIQLVRGKKSLHVKDVNSKFGQILQEIALAKKPFDLETEFKKKPRGVFIREDVQPFGPSGILKQVKLGENVKWNLHLEKAFYDTDLSAKKAIIELYQKGLFVSSIQKALSTGAFGLEKNRKFVPTRWSITAVDDTISLHLLEKVRSYSVIDCYQVYEIKTFNNYFAILLMPSYWQYEFLESFINVLGKEKVMFSSWEPFQGRKTYAEIGGCYYSCKLGILEKLERMKKQAGAIVFRESYEGYIPTGVWLVRECVREALRKPPTLFYDLKSALSYISTKLLLPFSRYLKQSSILKQTSLLKFTSQL